QMPVKIARSTPRPSFGLPELLVASHISRLAFRDAAKSLLSTLVSESSGECRSKGFCRSSRNCGRSHHQRQHETFDSHAFKSNRQASCPRKTILGGSRSYIHVRCHGHAPASHDRFAVHTGDAVVKRDCCRTKADRAVSAHVDRDAGDEHRLLRTSGWPILTVA